MTIKNKIATSLVAASLLSVTAFAAAGDTINVNGGGTISEELLTVAKDVNVSLGNFTITPSFSSPSSRNNPIFEFVFTPSIDATAMTTALAGFEVYEINGTNEYNASSPLSSGFTISGNTVSFAKSTGTASVTSGNTYGILNSTQATDDNASTPDNIASILVEVSSATEAAATGVTYEIYTGDSGLKFASDSKTNMYSVKPEYKITLDTPFDRRTDLCSGKVVFSKATGGCGADNNDTDTLMFTIARTDMSYDFNASGDASYMRVTGDSNLTVMGDAGSSVVTTSSANTLPTATPTLAHTGTSFEQNATITAANLAAASSTSTQVLALDYKVVGNVAITDTKFNWNFLLVGPDGNTTVKGSDSSGTAGEWKPYGYAAQIPNVSHADSVNISTVVSVTNTGSSSVPVFMTLVADGKECLVNSTDVATIADAAANSTTKYEAKTLLAACPSITASSFGLELDIATQPSDIYTSASYKRALTGNLVFKDLPVYSTSTMSY